MSQISHTTRSNRLETLLPPSVFRANSAEVNPSPVLGGRIVVSGRHRPGPAASAPWAKPLRPRHILRSEWKRLIDDLGTVILAGLCLAGVVIVASTFDGDLQGGNEIVAAILGTFSLFGLLAGLELADRLKMRRRGAR